MSYVLGPIYVDLESHGVTKDDLHMIFDYDEQSVKELLSGAISLEKDEMVKIAEFKKIPISELVGDKAIV